MRGAYWTATCAGVLLCLAGCAEPEPARTFVLPTLSVPTGWTPGSAAATPIAVQSPSGQTSGPGSSSAELRAKYPLTFATAQSYAGLGYVVAGHVPNGEIRVQKTTLTEWETKPVTERVCRERWNYAGGRSEQRCELETVYKRQPVLKTKFYVSGPGMATLAYDTVSQAFVNIAPTDYWRRMS